jgi:hypothetical protein
MSSVWEGTRTEAFCKGAELGAERERQRIIALLEKLTWTRDCLYTETIDCSLCRINVHEAIAHINGENK